MATGSERQKKFRAKKALEDPDYKAKESARISKHQVERWRKRDPAKVDGDRFKKKLYMREWRLRKKREEECIVKMGNVSPIVVLSPTGQQTRKSGILFHPGKIKAIEKLIKEKPDSPRFGKFAVEELTKELTKVVRLAVSQSEPYGSNTAQFEAAITEEHLDKKMKIEMTF